MNINRVIFHCQWDGHIFNSIWTFNFRDKNIKVNMDPHSNKLTNITFLLEYSEQASNWKLKTKLLKEPKMIKENDVNILALKNDVSCPKPIPIK